MKIRCAALFLCSLLPSVRITAITKLPKFMLCPLASPESSIVSVLPLVCGKMQTPDPEKQALPRLPPSLALSSASLESKAAGARMAP